MLLLLLLRHTYAAYEHASKSVAETYRTFPRKTNLKPCEIRSITWGTNHLELDRFVPKSGLRYKAFFQVSENIGPKRSTNLLFYPRAVSDVELHLVNTWYQSVVPAVGRSDRLIQDVFVFIVIARLSLS